jgi:hypothetical protein
MAIRKYRRIVERRIFISFMVSNETFSLSKVYSFLSGLQKPIRKS